MQIALFIYLIFFFGSEQYTVVNIKVAKIN